MIFLRAYLLLGMVFHKVVWEVMKRQERIQDSVQIHRDQSFLIRVIKLGKVLLLMFFVLQTFLPTIFPISEKPVRFYVTGVVVYSIGLIIAVAGRVQLGSNWVDLEDFQVITDQKIVQSGIYNYIRHPIYIGDVLLVIGLEMALNSWLVLIVLFIIPVIFKQARDEEVILKKAFPEYREYQGRTKMFIPYLI